MATSKLVNPALAFIRESLKQQKVVVFSKTFSPFSKVTKKRLNDINVSFLAIEMDKHTDYAKIQDALEEITGSRGAPRVFVNEKYVGDALIIKKLADAGKLEDLFKKEGVL